MHRNCFLPPCLEGKGLQLFSLSSFFPPSPLILTSFHLLPGLFPQWGLSFHLMVWLREDFFEVHPVGWRDSVPCRLLVRSWPRVFEMFIHQNKINEIFPFLLAFPFKACLPSSSNQIIFSIMSEAKVPWRMQKCLQLKTALRVIRTFQQYEQFRKEWAAGGEYGRHQWHCRMYV